MSNTVAVSVRNIEKQFDDLQALFGITFNVYEGELFGFLGPNGAGKTTTINILTGLARSDSGSIRIGNIDLIRRPRGAQSLIGVVPDESNLYPELSGFENLCFCAALYGINGVERRKRAVNLLEEFKLDESAHRKFGSYSKGMKRKLTIAAGIIHHPKILFLDEPTTGIDVASARQIRQLISNLNDQGTTIFLTTHYIEEAERLCDRIAFIVNGRIVKIDTVSNLLQPMQNKKILEISFKNTIQDSIKEINQAYPELEICLINNNTIKITSEEAVEVGKMILFMECRGLEVSEAKKIQPSLEEVFVSITGIEADIMLKEKSRGNQ